MEGREEGRVRGKGVCCGEGRDGKWRRLTKREWERSGAFLLYGGGLREGTGQILSGDISNKRQARLIKYLKYLVNCSL